MSTVNPKIAGVTDFILKAADNVTIPQVESAYSSISQGIAQGINPIRDADGIPSGGVAITPEGTPSIFNPFYLFRYSKYGTLDAASKYNPDFHKELILDPGTNGNPAGTQNTLNLFANQKREDIENPTADKIIQWAQASAGNTEGVTMSPVPYQWSDFLWCKWYGKIPNNRLLTLRRYPIPVEDNLRVDDSFLPLIPLAQAVTWWGADTGNTLGNILGMDFGLKWTNKTASVQDVIGNEIPAEKLLDSLGVENELSRKAILATLFSDQANPFAFTGFDAKLQEFVRNSYGNEGPYWNRILGPVNVVDSTQIRDRGMDFRHDIKLEFSYKLRSFGNINPKIALLDLISNFLSLTYNNAQFWGGATRYFQQTGPILRGINSEEFEKGNFIDGIADNLTEVVKGVQQQGAEIAKLIKALGDGITDLKDFDTSKLIEELGGSQIAQNLAGSIVKDLLQKPLLIRSFLDGRAVGEWHLTVGNPMDPVAVIGNLIVKSTNIKFSEDLGLDDFPSEVKFTVTLTHARPRARQDILSMFNLGGGDMYINDALQPPSSSFNSIGKNNSENAAAFRGATSQGGNSNAEIQNQVGIDTRGLDTSPNTTGGAGTLPDAEQVAKKYRTSISRAYGEGFGNSNALPRYFLDLNTKD